MKNVAFLVCCSLLPGCVWLSESRAVPHASLKLAISDGQTLDQAIAVADRAILKLGYAKEPNDWEKWQPILSEQELENKKKEATYLSNGMRIMYMPERNAQYLTAQPQAPLAVRPSFFLHFYEEEGYVFTDSGVAAYEALKAALASDGLQNLEEDENDKKHYRPLVTPSLFNEQHSPPSLRQRMVAVGYGAYAFAAYALVIVLPVCWFGFRALRNRTMPLHRKRLLFTGLGSLLLPPVPVPISMFGPLVLVPLPLVAPFALGLPSRYVLWVATSITVTAVLCLLISMMIRTAAAQQALPADAAAPRG